MLHSLFMSTYYLTIDYLHPSAKLTALPNNFKKYIKCINPETNAPLAPLAKYVFQINYETGYDHFM